MERSLRRDLDPPTQPASRLVFEMLTGGDFDCIGATQDEIAEIAGEQPSPMPEAYRQYLLLAGRQCGSVWTGSDAFYPSVLGIRVVADELLESARAAPLGADDFVILLHQGYTFVYLHGAGPDPEVRQFVEGDPEPRIVAPSFTEFLLFGIEEADGRT